jgi:hypothetical protein
LGGSARPGAGLTIMKKGKIVAPKNYVHPAHKSHFIALLFPWACIELLLLFCFLLIWNILLHNLQVGMLVYGLYRFY